MQFPATTKREHFPAHFLKPALFWHWNQRRHKKTADQCLLWFRFFCCLVAKSCPTLCDPMDCSPPGSSSVHGILQARTLEWGAISHKLNPVACKEDYTPRPTGIYLRMQSWFNIRKSKLIYRFNAICIKIQLPFFFFRHWHADTNIHMEMQGTQHSQDSLENKDKVGRLHTPRLRSTCNPGSVVLASE